MSSIIPSLRSSPNSVKLSRCSMHHSWRPLIEVVAALDRKQDNSMYVGGCGVSFHQKSVKEIRIGIEVVSVGQPAPPPLDFRELVEIAPRLAGSAPDRPREATRKYDLNHFAVNSKAFERDTQAWSRFLDEQPLMDDTRSWSVGDQAYVRAAHFYAQNSAYITIRDRPNEGFLDHIGFLCATEESVHRAFDLVTGLTWEILNKPEFLDGSVLFHFRGPDGRIHDFYHPTAKLGV